MTLAIRCLGLLVITVITVNDGKTLKSSNIFQQSDAEEYFSDSYMRSDDAEGLVPYEHYVIALGEISGDRLFAGKDSPDAKQTTIPATSTTTESPKTTTVNDDEKNSTKDEEDEEKTDEDEVVETTTEFNSRRNFRYRRNKEVNETDEEDTKVKLHPARDGNLAEPGEVWIFEPFEVNDNKVVYRIKNLQTEMYLKVYKTIHEIYAHIVGMGGKNESDKTTFWEVNYPYGTIRNLNYDEYLIPSPNNETGGPVYTHLHPDASVEEQWTITPKRALYNMKLPKTKFHG